MFARIVTMPLKPGTSPEFAKTIEEGARPLLRRNKGFLDDIALVSAEGKTGFGISFWDSKEDAEAYDRSGFAAVKKALDKVLGGPTEVKKCEVTNAAHIAALVAPGPAIALDNLDCVKADPAHHKVLFENDQVRVVRWVVAAGDTTLSHFHPDHLNICLTEYHGKVTLPEGKVSTVRAEAGSVTWRRAGAHTVKNLTSHPMEGILVEPKEPASARPADSPDPVAVDPEHHKVEFENDRLRVLRERREPGNLPMHGHPDNVQVLLTDMHGTLTTADGKTHKFAGKAGDVHWRPPTQHTGVVLGEKPVEQVVIEMKGKPGYRKVGK